VYTDILELCNALFNTHFILGPLGHTSGWGVALCAHKSHICVYRSVEKLAVMEDWVVVVELSVCRPHLLRWAKWSPAQVSEWMNWTQRFDGLKAMITHKSSSLAGYHGNCSCSNRSATELPLSSTQQPMRHQCTQSGCFVMRWLPKVCHTDIVHVQSECALRHTTMPM